MNPSTNERNSQSLRAWHSDLSNLLGRHPVDESAGDKAGRTLILLLVAAALACLSITANSQSLAIDESSSEATAHTTPGQLNLTYSRPTQRTMAANYVFDAFGPYPIVGSAFVAGINQIDNAPPEWKLGAEGYGKRFGSAFAIAAVGTTTRYGLAEVFKEDTLYYRCECTGVFPRMGYAAISTLTARRGRSGRRVFSLPSLIAPYAGSMAAIYGWYPERFGIKDAFRMGNYTLLANVGGNIALEFFYSGSHSLLSRMHLNNAHGAPAPGPNH
jgi:hypothetical protein